MGLFEERVLSGVFEERVLCLRCFVFVLSGFVFNFLTF